MIASSREYGRNAAAAGVRQMVLSHFRAAMNSDSVESDVRERYSGPLVIGADLMEIGVQPVADHEPAWPCHDHSVSLAKDYLGFLLPME